MPIYKKRKNSDVWHWYENCSNWPTYDYEVQYVELFTEPNLECRCKECLAKERERNHRKYK